MKDTLSYYKKDESFSPVPSSCGECRSLVSLAMEHFDLDELLDSAVLLTSELVTNAVLHAKTEILVHVLAEPDGVRVEVEDFLPSLPIPKNYDTDATTGRGLHLLDHLATAWGTERFDNSKIVWFELRRGATKQAPVFTVDLSEWPDLEDTGSLHTVPIHIQHLSVELYRQFSEHADGLAREFALVAASPDTAPGRIPPIMKAIEELHLPTQTADVVLAQAVAQGDDYIDLDYNFPSEVGPLIVDILKLMDDLDEYCRTGSLLLSLASPPELVAFRRWFLGEFIDQLNGKEPTPFQG